VPSVTKFGARITQAATAAARVPALVAVQSSPPPIAPDRWARNSIHPDAQFVSLLNETGNQAGLFRTKEVFRAIGRLESGNGVFYPPLSFGAGDRARYRWAFRSGPYCHAVRAIVGMAPPTSGLDQNTSARLDIANGAGSVVASATFTYGVHPGGVLGWRHIQQIIATIDGLSPDTEYFGTFYDVDYGIIQSACVYELASFTEHADGYLASNITNRSAILDIHRQNLAELSNALWQKGGAQVFCYTVEDGTIPITNSTSTFKNILDTSVTTVSAASPGWTLDMTGKARLSQTTGVPVTMKVCGRNQLTGTGVVKLVNSAGATVMSITNGWSTTTPGWQSATGMLPAGVDKYDVQVSNNGSGSLDTYAVSVYEYG
jgi:hypothetical protein